MKIKILMVFCSIIFIYSQQKDVIELGTEEIKVDKEVPRVSIIKSRIKPIFPEIPIKKNFKDEILDKYSNSQYIISKRKIIVSADIEKEINKIK